MMLGKGKYKLSLLLNQEANIAKPFTNDDQPADLCFIKVSHHNKKYLQFEWKVSFTMEFL